MGLDISALTGLKPVDGEGENTWFIYINKDFPKQGDGLKEGYYEFDEEFEFRAGSYSGYNAWRDRLARLVGYASAEDAWAKNQGPMIDLINFADNEGVIGPEHCKKLHAEFVEWCDKARQITDDPWFFKSYKNWLKAFKLGSLGCVLFH